MTDLIYGAGGQTRIRQSDIAYPGMFLEKTMTIEALNLAGEVPQILVVKLNSAAPNTEYAVTINGYPLTFTTPSAVTMAELQILLLNKFSAIPEVSGFFSLSITGTDSITLKADRPGQRLSFVGSATVSVTQTQAPQSAKGIPAGIVLTGRPDYVSGLQIAGEPSSLEEVALGVPQYNHSVPHELGQNNNFKPRQAMSLVVQGKGWLEFESPADKTLVGAKLYYRAVSSAANPNTGRLIYAATPPDDCVEFNGVLNSETSGIADGRIVGLVTFSLI